MTSTILRYTKSNYKYQVKDDFIIATDIKPKSNILSDFINLDTDGILTIRKGYAWDGCSGPTWDTKSTMRAGCVHDAFFQLMRLNVLDRNQYFHPVNKLFYFMLRQDGVLWLRAEYYYKAVEKISWRYTMSKKDPEIQEAP